jgi:Putative Ig domain
MRYGFSTTRRLSRPVWRPHLEMLEERCVPTTGTGVGVNPDNPQAPVVNQGNLTIVTTSGINLVANPGFETGNFTDWTQSGNTGYMTVSTEDAHSGLYKASLGPVGSLGYLSQNVATTIGTQYTFSWYLQSDGETPNEFQASWNGTVIFDQTNLPAFDYTLYSFTETATSTSTPIQFGFQDDPGYLHLDDVSVSSSGGLELPITISPTTLPTAAVGFSYPATTLTATGGSGEDYSFEITAGNLPSGMTLSSAGVLSGTPTTATESPFTFTVTATDSLGGTGLQNYSLTVNESPPVFINAPPSVTINQGDSLSLSFLAIDPQEEQVTYSLVPATNLGSNAVPQGMQIDPQTGLLTWPAGSIPSEVQDTTYPVTVRATDCDGNYQDATVLVTVLTDSTSAFESTVLSSGETGTISLPDGDGSLSIQTTGGAGNVVAGLGEYTQNPAPIASPGPGLASTSYFDVWVENADLLSSLTLTIPAPGTGTFVLQYLNQSDQYVSVPTADYTIGPSATPGDLQITFIPPFTLFTGTVFAVSVASPVVQPTPVQPATAQANSTSNTASDVSPAAVQTINFISTTQLTLTVSAAQDSQQTAALTSQGSGAVAAVSGVGRVVTVKDGEVANMDLERQAWWFQFGDEMPWYLIGPPAQQAKPGAANPQVPQPGENDDSFSDGFLFLDESFTVKHEDQEMANVSDGRFFPKLSEYEFRTLSVPTFRAAEPRDAEQRPMPALTLPFLVLGARLAENYRAKERARKPVMFRKEMPRAKARKAQKKTKAQRKKRVERADRIKSRLTPSRAAAPIWLLLAFFLVALFAFV